MPAGHQAAFDRVRTLVTSTAALTESAGTTVFEEYPARQSLESAPESEIHRRFRVLYDGAQPMPNRFGEFAGDLLDDVLAMRVQVAYHEGGGDAATDSDALGIDRLAVDDLNRLRQHLEHPTNYDHANTGISRVEWSGTRLTKEADGESRVRIYELALRAFVRHATLT